MTGREQQVCKAILRAAHEADGHQLTELELHAGAGQITATEFDACLKICDTNRWLTGVTSKYNERQKLWNLNSRGEAALHEL